MSNLFDKNFSESKTYTALKRELAISESHQGKKTEDALNDTINAPTIETVRELALKGDLDNTIKILDELKINYIKTTCNNKTTIAFAYGSRKYEYAFFSAAKSSYTKTSSVNISQLTREEIDSQFVNTGLRATENTGDIAVNNGNSSASTGNEDPDLDYWLDRPCGGTVFPKNIIESLFSAEEISKCFTLDEDGYKIKREEPRELNLRYPMGNMMLYEIREALNNFNNNEVEKNVYIHADSYSKEELVKYNFTEQEMTEYFVKINNRYYVKYPIIIDGQTLDLPVNDYTPWGLIDALRDYMCSSGRETFDNIFDFYYYHKEQPDKNEYEPRHYGAVNNPEEKIRSLVECEFRFGEYKYGDEPGVREYVKSKLGQDYSYNIYEYLMNKAYNSLNISDYYSDFDPENKFVTILTDKLINDLLSAIDIELTKYKEAVERRKGDDFDDIWDYYSREELGIDPAKDGNAWVGGPTDPEFNISLYYRDWLQDADYTGYAASRWGMRDKMNTNEFKNAYNSAWNNAFESLNLELYYTKTANGDYIILINKFKEDFINALDQQITNTKPQT